MSDAKAQYSEALIDRRAGGLSQLGPETPFTDVKGDYYADARILCEDALEAFDALKETHGPYGLVGADGETPFPMGNGDMRSSGLFGLTRALKNTAHLAFENATPSVSACPYSKAIRPPQLGETYPVLAPYDHDERGLDTLRSVVTPGGELNAPLFVSLALRMPALQRLHGDQSDPERFARASVSLLREPLAHPQQWAKGFVFSLGHMGELLNNRFLGDDLAREFTEIEATHEGVTRLAWAKPAEELRLRQDIEVTDRTKGPEVGDDAVRVHYPEGTMLKDIEVTEPNLGCPGDQFARAMWQRTIDVFVGEELWTK